MWEVTVTSTDEGTKSWKMIEDYRALKMYQALKEAMDVDTIVITDAFTGEIWWMWKDKKDIIIYGVDTTK